MTNDNALRLIAACVFLLGLNSAPALAQPGRPIGIDVPPVPAAIEVPAGHSVYFKTQAVGTQNYICLATSSGLTWRFLGPQATLFTELKNGTYQQVATHFLSANPVENGLARPTWQHSFDSSQFWGRVLASSSDSAFVEPGAIAWLLLEAAGTGLGPANGWYLAQTTFIQRLNTSGGAVPSEGCSQTTDVGAMALVPYAADYYFYRANQ